MGVELERLFLGKTTGQFRQTLREVTEPGIADNFYPARYSQHTRTPDVITTKAWLSKGEYIKCFVNPSQTNWNVSRRESFVKTAAGFVRNTWRNRFRDTYFDNFPIQFTFQAGNIMPSAGYGPIADNAINNPQRIVDLAKSPRIPPGLDNFYKFLSLVDQPALGGKSANYHIMVYHSRVFPQIWLEGFFEPENSPSWSETSENGNTVTWTASFMVARTVPRLSAYRTMQALYFDWMLSSGAINEALPIELAKKLLSEAEVINKIFADWGWGGMPSKGASKVNPAAAARTKSESLTKVGDVVGNLIATGGATPDTGYPGSVTPVGQVAGQGNQGKSIVNQGGVGSTNPYDSTGPIIW